LYNDKVVYQSETVNSASSGYVEQGFCAGAFGSRLHRLRYILWLIRLSRNFGRNWNRPSKKRPAEQKK
jgi:hypothetical protein